MTPAQYSTNSKDERSRYAHTSTPPPSFLHPPPSHQLNQAYLDSQHSREQHECKLQTCESVILDCKHQEEDLKENLRHAQETTVQGRAAVVAQGNEVAMMRDREAQIQACAREAAAKTGSLVETLRHHDAEVDAAEERLRQIERMLIEQRTELDTKMTAREAARVEVEANHMREDAAAADMRDAQLLIQTLLDSCRVAEENVAAYERAERDAQSILQSAATECMKAVGTRDGALRELQISVERQEQSLLVLQNALSASEGQSAAILEAEQRNAEFNRHRRVVEEEEAPLIDQEALLKDQRDMLDEREARLRHEVHHFTSHNGRSPATSPRAAVRPSVAQSVATVMSPPQLESRGRVVAATPGGSYRAPRAEYYVPQSLARGY